MRPFPAVLVALSLILLPFASPGAVAVTREEVGVKMGGPVWVEQFGFGDVDAATAVVEDASGAYVAGYSLIPPDLEEGLDQFVGTLRKYDPDGNRLWTRHFGTTGQDFATALAIDATGVYVAGDTNGTLASPNAGGVDAFLLKFDFEGNELWAQQFGSPADEHATAVAVDATGVYVAGGTNGTLSGEASPNGVDAFLRKHDLEGDPLWTRQFGTAGDDVAHALAADGSGLYVAGEAGDGLAEGSGAGGRDAFLRKYSEAGDLLWTDQFGSSDDDAARSLSADASGVYLSGQTSGQLPGQEPVGAIDAFLRKYDGEGSVLWTRQFGTTEDDTAWAVASHPLGVYVGGTTTGVFAGQLRMGGIDAFFARFDPAGTRVYVRQFGTNEPDLLWDLTAGDERIYAAGVTQGQLAFLTPGVPYPFAFLAQMGETPEPPRALRAAPGDGEAVLTWDPPAFDGGTAITNYSVYRGPDPGNLTLVAALEAASTYRDVAVTNGETYHYVVSARNHLGEGPASEAVAVIPGPTEVLPLGPVLVAGIVGAAVAAGALFLLRRRRSSPTGPEAPPERPPSPPP